MIRFGVDDKLLEVVQKKRQWNNNSALCRDRQRSSSPTTCFQAEPLVMNAEIIPRAASAVLGCRLDRKCLEEVCQMLHFKGMQK